MDSEQPVSPPSVDNTEPASAAPEKEQTPLLETIRDIAADTQEQLRSNTLTYDSYMEAIITRMKDADDLFLRARIKNALIDMHGSSFKPETWTVTNEMIARVRVINPEYVPLLLDAGIALRRDDFVTFCQQNPDLDPLELRRQFIATFPVTEYYRAVVLKTDKPDIKNSHLAPEVRQAVEHPKEVTEAYIAKSLRLFTSYQQGSARTLSLPLISDVEEDAKVHRFDRGTDGPFISVSEHPEVAWRAATYYKNEMWRKWGEGTKVRIFKFPMNSFYPLPASELLPDFLDPDSKLTFSDGQRAFEIPVIDPSVEQLVPLALPEDYQAVFKDYFPVRDASGTPISLTMPSKEDWDTSENVSPVQ